MTNTRDYPESFKQVTNLFEAYPRDDVIETFRVIVVENLSHRQRAEVKAHLDRLLQPPIDPLRLRQAWYDTYPSIGFDPPEAFPHLFAAWRQVLDELPPADG